MLLNKNRANEWKWKSISNKIRKMMTQNVNLRYFLFSVLERENTFCRNMLISLFRKIWLRYCWTKCRNNRSSSPAISTRVNAECSWPLVFLPSAATCPEIRISSCRVGEMLEFDTRAQISKGEGARWIREMCVLPHHPVKWTPHTKQPLLL